MDPELQKKLEGALADIATLKADVAAIQSPDVLSYLKIRPTDLVGYAGYFFVVRTTLTAAQVKALHTTPITLVPAPGSNAVIVVESIDAQLTFNANAYTGANALEFRYTDGSGTKVTADMSSTFLDNSATAYDHVAGVVTEITPVANAAVVVAVPTANPAAGDSVIRFVVKCRIISF